MPVNEHGLLDPLYRSAADKKVLALSDGDYHEATMNEWSDVVPEGEAYILNPSSGPQKIVFFQNLMLWA